MDIVLDLDETLVNTQDNTQSLCDLKILTDPKLVKLRTRIYHINIEELEGPGCGSNYGYWGVIRPFTKEFLKFCFDYFRYVIVWSAGKRFYVEAIVDHLFKDLPKPHYIFSYDDTVFKRKGDDKITIKPLTKLYAAVNKKYGNNLMNETTTLAIDDTETTFSENVENGIKIPAYQITEYEVAPTIEDITRSDERLKQLMNWLNANRGAKDVRVLDKSRIF
jgi:hypothetical protein